MNRHISKVRSRPSYRPVLESLEVRRVPAGLGGLDILTPPLVNLSSAGNSDQHSATTPALSVNDTTNLTTSVLSGTTLSTNVAINLSSSGNGLNSNTSAASQLGNGGSDHLAVQADLSSAVGLGRSASAELHADANAHFNRSEAPSVDMGVAANVGVGIGGAGGVTVAADAVLTVVTSSGINVSGGATANVAVNNVDINIVADGQVTIQTKGGPGVTGGGGVQGNIGGQGATVILALGAGDQNPNGGGSNGGGGSTGGNGNNGGLTGGGTTGTSGSSNLNGSGTTGGNTSGPAQITVLPSAIDSGNHAGNLTDAPLDEDNLFDFFLPLDPSLRPDDALSQLLLSQISLSAQDAAHGAGSEDATASDSRAGAVPAADDPAAGAATGAVEAATPGMQEADLLVQFQPVDPAALAAVMQQYLDQVSTLGEGLASLLSTLGPSAWMTVAAITVTAYELARQRQRRRKSVIASDGTVPGQLPPEFAMA